MIPNSAQRELLLEIEKLQNLRRQLISFLNELDDLLQLPRTVPTKEERAVLNKVREFENVNGKLNI